MGVATERRWARFSWWADRLQERLPGPARRVLQRARADDIPLLAAGVGFYALVSLLPMVIVALWAAGVLVSEARVQEFADKVSRVAPRGMGIDSAVQGVADQGTNAGIVAALVALWPASAYGSGLAQAFERITPHPDRGRSGGHGRGLTIVVLLPLFIFGSILAVFWGSRILEDAAVGAVLGPVAGLLAGFALAIVVVGVVYWIFPPERLQWQAVLKATLFTAGGVAILSLGMVLYLTLGANFEERYATSWMGVVILMAIWLYLANVLLLVGYKLALEADPTSEKQAPQQGSREHG